VTVNAAAAQNLAVNGGFETGDFTGWTLSGNTGFTGVGTADVHSGNYSAYLGPIGSDVHLDQVIATTAGDTYQVEFWLLNPGGTPSDFSASFGGTTLMSLVNTSAQGYTEYVFDVATTSSSTDLDFSARQDPSYWYLDDVSVVQVSPVSTSIPWLNATSGFWLDNAADWSGGAVPTGVDDVTVAASGGAPYIVTLNTGETAYADSLKVNDVEATVLDQGTLVLTGPLTIDAGAFNLAGGTLSASTIAVSDSGAFVGYGSVSSSVAITGTIEASGGTLDFAGAVTGSSTFDVNGSTLEFDSTVAATATVSFQSEAGTLALAPPSPPRTSPRSRSIKVRAAGRSSCRRMPQATMRRSPSTTPAI
jgi:hypothetical protein